MLPIMKTKTLSESEFNEINQEQEDKEIFKLIFDLDFISNL